eukprot:m.318857 g.318857  ORF g.318857 m.318857 type:complete len:58 (+) comp15990_c0_seq38:205-378(+)
MAIARDLARDLALINNQDSLSLFLKETKVCPAIVKEGRALIETSQPPFELAVDVSSS